MDQLIDDNETSEVLPPGTLIAERYQIQHVIGQGSMGVVYKARQIFIKRDVALKMLLEDNIRGTRGFLRFKQEAQAASLLDHPNIVTILDFGLIGNNQAYLAMDYLEGLSLGERIDSKEISLEVFTHIFLQVCDGLAHAHEKGMVHRDIKPGNIMLTTRESDENFVVIVDFGLVKLLESPTDQRLTATDVVIGSPLYMSPEQCRGLEIDARSDIYSLGCVMYETLTTAPPMLGDTVVDTMLKHISETPVSVREARPGIYVPPSLERLISRCMAKDPVDRPQTMMEVAEGIRAAMSGAPDVPKVTLNAASLSASSITNISKADLVGIDRSKSSGTKPNQRANKATSMDRQAQIWVSIGPWLGVACVLSISLIIAMMVTHPANQRKRFKPAPVAAAPIPTVSPDDSIIIGPANVWDKQGIEINQR